MADDVVRGKEFPKKLRVEMSHDEIEKKGRERSRADLAARGERFVDWSVVGGESGRGARPCDVDWVRSLVAQHRVTGTPVFVKQLGANVRDRNDRFNVDDDADQALADHWPGVVVAGDMVECNPDGVREDYQGAPVRIRLPSKGGRMKEWPPDLRVRMMPGDRWEA